MKYANDLPDGFCVVANRLENGTKSLKQLASLIKAISKLELDFAKNLDKLVEKTKKAAAGMAFEVATTHDAWGTLLSETGRLAKTHSEIGLALNDKCATAMKVFEKEYTREVKVLRGSGMTLLADADAAVKRIEKAHKKAQAGQATSQAATAAAANGGGDEKLQQKAEKAQEKCMECWRDYGTVYATSHQFCTDFYEKNMPRLLEMALQMDQRRISQCKQMIQTAIETVSLVIPSTTGLVELVGNAMTHMDPVVDVDTFISSQKADATAFTPISVPPFDNTNSEGVTIFPPVGPQSATRSRADSTTVVRPTFRQSVILSPSANPAAPPASTNASAAGGSPASPPVPAVAVQARSSESDDARASTHAAPAAAPVDAHVSDDIDVNRLSAAIIVPADDDFAEPELYVALYDFAGEEVDDIAFKAGDEVLVYGIDPDGWLRASVDGGKTRGLAPSNYVKKKSEM